MLSHKVFSSNSRDGVGYNRYRLAMRTSILLSVQREFALHTRLLIALFALIQLIAPTWHICEMGAASCCPPAGDNQALHCPLPASSSLQNAHCEPGSQDEPQFIVSATPDPHEENCLAKLLMGMPWQSVAALELPRPVTDHLTAVPSTPHCVSLAALPQPPSRGPPLFS